MTTTGFTVGLTSEEKPSSKILKPPGGGSHDIFNTGGGGGSANALDMDSPRRVKNYQKTNLFDGSETGHVKMTSPSRGQAPGNDTMNRLFGPTEQPQSLRKVNNYMKSSIFGESEWEKNDESKTNVNRDLFAGEGVIPNTPQSAKKQGSTNPITGAGYENGTNHTNGNAVAPTVRVRNPPGGPSTKLW